MVCDHDILEVSTCVTSTALDMVESASENSFVTCMMANALNIANLAGIASATLGAYLGGCIVVAKYWHDISTSPGFMI